MTHAARLRAAVRRLTEALHTGIPASDVLQSVVEEARRLTDAASAALCLLTDSRDMLDFVAAAGENADDILGLRIRVADSLSETVVETGQPFLLDQRSAAQTGDLFSAAAPTERLASKPPVQNLTAAVVPLHADGRLIGTLSALNKTGDAASGSPIQAFGSEDLETLALLGEFATLARKVERTARTARDQGRELAVLYDAARTVAGSLNVQQVMDNVLTALCSHVEYHAAVLFLLNDEHTHLFIAAERGLTDEEREIQLSVESGEHARVLISGQPRRIKDTDLTSDFVDITLRSHALSAMIAPVRSRDEIHGIIVVTSLQRRAYHSADLKLVAAVAMQAGIAIENAWLYEDAQRQAEEATALYDLSQHVNATLHEDHVLNFVADSVLNLLKVDRFALMLYDAREERLKTKLSRNMDAGEFHAIMPRAGEGIAGWVFEWQTPQAVADVAADARNRTAPLDPFGVASTLCVPMHVGEEVIGVIHAMSSKRRLFTVAEMELLYTIANQAAVAIVNAHLYKEARTKSHEMRRYFRRVAHAIGSALEEQELPRLLADLSVEIMRADRCAIYRLDGDMLRLQVASGFRSAVPPDATVPLGQGLCGHVARRGQSLSLPDLNDDPRSQTHHWLQRDKLTSYLGVPLRSARRVVGVIEIYTQERREFSREETQLLSTFVRRARVANKIAQESV